MLTITAIHLRREGVRFADGEQGYVSGHTDEGVGQSLVVDGDLVHVLGGFPHPVGVWVGHGREGGEEGRGKR